MALRCGVVTNQIVSKAALHRHFCAGKVRLIGQIEPADRLERLIGAQHGNADARAHPAAAGRNLLGAGEEADCRIGIADIERGPSGIDQRAHVTRIMRKARQRCVERARRAGRGRLHDRLGHRRGRLAHVVIGRGLLGMNRQRLHAGQRSPEHHAAGNGQGHSGEAADHRADLITAWD